MKKIRNKDLDGGTPVPVREEMELKDILLIIQKRLGIIALITVVAVAASAIISFFCWTKSMKLRRHLW